MSGSSAISNFRFPAQTHNIGSPQIPSLEASPKRPPISHPDLFIPTLLSFARMMLKGQAGAAAQGDVEEGEPGKSVRASMQPRSS